MLIMNRLLRRMFVPGREERKGGRRILRNEDLHELYPSQSVFRMVKSRGMEHVHNFSHKP